MGAAAAQMKSCVHIIGGHWKRSLLPAPSLSGVRPTPARVRETVFNWLGQRLEGYTCVDLFAGSGALGFERASCGNCAKLRQSWMPAPLKLYALTRCSF